ncbi:MAG: hypothetical protein ABL888_08920 [Pirellulaceae bacterium]
MKNRLPFLTVFLVLFPFWISPPVLLAQAKQNAQSKDAETTNKNSTEKIRVQPNTLASRVGTAIQWETDYATALAKARQANRPIFWYIPSIPGTFMDRQPEIDRYMMAGAFSWPAIINLINEKTVPLRAVPLESEAKKFGLATYDFIEPGFLVVSTNEIPAVVADRLTTQQPKWLFQILAKSLGEARSWVEVSGQQGSDKIESAWQLAEQKEWQFGENDWIALEKENSIELKLLAGMMAFRTGRQRAAKEIWERASEQFPQHPLGWKAACEAQGIGPYVRGFEVFTPVSDAVKVPLNGALRITSSAPIGSWSESQLWKSSVSFLLGMQDETGGFFDSDYDFGGTDGLPNVHVAITSLAGLALLDALDRCESAPLKERIQNAIDRAVLFVSNDRNLNLHDRDEILWAQAYRVKLLAAVGKRLNSASTMKSLQLAVKELERLQMQNGSWYHEYPNSFVTGTALSALHSARESGASVSSDSAEKGLERLAKQRYRNGAFPYAVRQAEPPEAPEAEGSLEASGGRISVCELARHQWGKITDAELAEAANKSLNFHGLMAKALKYDDHTSTYAYGGFFFWYDMQARSETIGRISDATTRAKLAAKQRAIILELPEIDGCFVDSHELGRCYGTAMALLSLSQVETEQVRFK